MSRRLAVALGALLIALAGLVITTAVASAAAPDTGSQSSGTKPTCPGTTSHPAMIAGKVQSKVTAKCTGGQKLGAAACVQTLNGGSWKSLNCGQTAGTKGQASTATATAQPQCGTQQYRTRGVYTYNAKSYEFYSKTVSLPGGTGCSSTTPTDKQLKLKSGSSPKSSKSNSGSDSKGSIGGLGGLLGG